MTQKRGTEPYRPDGNGKGATRRFELFKSVISALVTGRDPKSFNNTDVVKTAWYLTDKSLELEFSEE
jgi:hypothetical protein